MCNLVLAHKAKNDSYNLQLEGVSSTINQLKNIFIIIVSPTLSFCYDRTTSMEIKIFGWQRIPMAAIEVNNYNLLLTCCLSYFELVINHIGQSQQAAAQHTAGKLILGFAASAILS
jgi:hypothetical protein